MGESAGAAHDDRIHNPELEALVQKRLATGGYANAEEVLHRALEVLNDEETWSVDERNALDRKIQVALGKVYGPDATPQKLAEMRAAHLTGSDR